MLWILLVVFVAIVASLCVFIDNYVSDVFLRGKQPYAQKIIGIFSYLLIAIIIAILFPLDLMPFNLILIFMLAGIISSLGSIPYYRALSSENSTAATIFIQLSPIIYLFVGWSFFGEVITPIQIIAFLLLLAAPFLIILSTRKKQQKLQIVTALFLIIYVVFAVSSNLIFVDFSREVTFTTAFFWYIIGKFLTDLLLSLIFKSWRKRFKTVFKRFKLKFALSTLSSQVLGAISEIAYRLALSLAPVAIVSATANSLQLIVTFFMGLILTALWPNFGRENLNKRTIIIHLIAASLAVLGIILIQ